METRGVAAGVPDHRDGQDLPLRRDLRESEGPVRTRVDGARSPAPLGSRDARARDAHRRMSCRQGSVSSGRKSRRARRGSAASRYAPFGHSGRISGAGEAKQLPREGPGGAQADVRGPEVRTDPAPERRTRGAHGVGPAAAVNDELFGVLDERVERRTRPVPHAARRVHHAVDGRRRREDADRLRLRRFCANAPVPGAAPPMISPTTLRRPNALSMAPLLPATGGWYPARDASRPCRSVAVRDSGTRSGGKDRRLAARFTSVDDQDSRMQKDLHPARVPVLPARPSPSPWTPPPWRRGRGEGAPMSVPSPWSGAFDPAPATRGTAAHARADFSRGPRTRRGPGRPSRLHAGPLRRAPVGRARRRATQARPSCGARGCGRSRRGP